jgi:hypothetical protein
LKVLTIHGFSLTLRLPPLLPLLPLSPDDDEGDGGIGGGTLTLT